MSASPLLRSLFSPHDIPVGKKRRKEKKFQEKRKKKKTANPLKKKQVKPPRLRIDKRRR